MALLSFIVTKGSGMVLHQVVSRMVSIFEGALSTTYHFFKSTTTTTTTTTTTKNSFFTGYSYVSCKSKFFSTRHISEKAAYKP